MSAVRLDKRIVAINRAQRGRPRVGNIQFWNPAASTGVVPPGFIGPVQPMHGPINYRGLGKNFGFGRQDSYPVWRPAEKNYVMPSVKKVPVGSALGPAFGYEFIRQPVSHQTMEEKVDRLRRNASARKLQRVMAARHRVYPVDIPLRPGYSGPVSYSHRDVAYVPAVEVFDISQQAAARIIQNLLKRRPQKEVAKHTLPRHQQAMAISLVTKRKALREEGKKLARERALLREFTPPPSKQGKLGRARSVERGAEEGLIYPSAPVYTRKQQTQLQKDLHRDFGL